MPRSAVLTLGESNFEVPALNIDQLERVTELYAALDVKDSRAVARLPFAIVKIALERATPKVDLATVQPASLDEVRAAMDKVTALSGLQQPDANPPAPKAGDA